MATTTIQDTPSISEVLKERREETGASKRSIYGRLGVSSQTYDAWEIGLYVPSDDHAEVLADYLGIELREIVWMLYRSRTQAKGVYISSDSRSAVIDLTALEQAPADPDEMQALIRSLQEHPAGRAA